MACELRLLLSMVDILGKLSQFHGQVQGMLIGMRVLTSTLDCMFVIRDLSLQLLMLSEP